MDEHSFRVWDQNKQGLIDAFEIFSGLVIFSNENFSKKLQFLFELFDLNEETFLNITELEFMLNTCVTSLFKVFDLPIDSVDQKEITAFVSKNFPSDVQIDLSMFKNWMEKNKYIFQFMQLLKQSPDNKRLDNSKVIMIYSSEAQS